MSTQIQIARQYDVTFRKDRCLGDSDRGEYTTGIHAVSAEDAKRQIERNWAAYNARVSDVRLHCAEVSR